MLLLIEVNECGLSVSLNLYLETTLTNQNFVNKTKCEQIELRERPATVQSRIFCRPVRWTDFLET